MQAELFLLFIFKMPIFWQYYAWPICAKAGKHLWKKLIQILTCVFFSLMLHSEFGLDQGQKYSWYSLTESGFGKTHRKSDTFQWRSAFQDPTEETLWPRQILLSMWIQGPNQEIVFKTQFSKYESHTVKAPEYFQYPNSDPIMN